MLIESGTFTATLIEIPQEKPNSYKSLLKTIAVIRNDTVNPANETMLVYFEKNEKVKALNAGEIILFKQKPQLVKNNGNPFEFDYKKYLERKRIYRQVYLSDEDWIESSESQLLPSLIAEQTRGKLLQIYRNQPIDSTELEILSALTLGYKRDLDPDTKRVFSSAGAMHVLAVSGLHVGIIFWLISLLFGFLRKFRNGRIFFVFIVLDILWAYAFITGLSPSVVRATLMFSIFLIGENLNRKANVYNSLAASAFVILLINPNNIFEIGFQLSYSAVFTIVFLQPKLAKYINSTKRIPNFFLTLFTVSLAAQIGTIPFTLYYFGRFPIYFWLTNTLMIPAVMVLIPMGMALLLLSKIQLLAAILSWCINYLIKFIYQFLSFIENLPYSVMHLSISSLQFLFFSIMLLMGFIFLQSKRGFYLKLSLILFIFVISTSLIANIQCSKSNEIIVYNSSGNTVIQLRNGFNNYVVSEKMINRDDYILREINAATEKFNLNPPVFLNSTDTFSNNAVIIKNRIIFFAGKTILFNHNLNSTNNNISPDFWINPVYNADCETRLERTQIVFTNIRYKPDFNPDIYRIHNTVLKGAFRKIW